VRLSRETRREEGRREAGKVGEGRKGRRGRVKEWERRLEQRNGEVNMGGRRDGGTRWKEG